MGKVIALFLLAVAANAQYFPPIGSSSGGTWGSITGTLSSQTDLNTALGLKAPLASPTFTGTVTVGSVVSINGTTGDITTQGAVIVGSGSGVAGLLAGTQGTAPTLPANSFGFSMPTAITTSQFLEPPNAVPAAHSVMVIAAPSSNKSTFAYKVISDCTDTVGNHLNFTQSTDAFSCGTSLPASPVIVSSSAADPNTAVTFKTGAVPNSGTQYGAKWQFSNAANMSQLFSNAAGDTIHELYGGGTGRTAGFFAFDSSTSANSAYAAYGVATAGSYFGTTGAVIFASSKNGSGTQLPIWFGGYSGSWTTAMQIVPTGGVSIGNITDPGAGQLAVNGLKTTGAANGKTVVCVDTATGKLYASTSGVACAN